MIAEVVAQFGLAVVSSMTALFAIIFTIRYAWSVMPVKKVPAWLVIFPVLLVVTSGWCLFIILTNVEAITALGKAMIAVTFITMLSMYLFVLSSEAKISQVPSQP